jgi:hypothetical protein
MQQGLDNISTKELDVISLDLDGNDFYFARAILEKGILPKLFIIEYNAKFPPPIKWTIAYNAEHLWDGSDYFGASLALFSELFEQFSYTLLCCNAATGANAFLSGMNIKHTSKTCRRILTISSSRPIISFLRRVTNNRQQPSSEC